MPEEITPAAPAAAPAVPNLAEELAAIKQQLAANQATSQETKSYMEGIQKAATGKVEPVAKPAHEAFVDDLITKGSAPVVDIVDQRLQRKAYLDTLANNFRKENPHLAPLEEEIFGRANHMVNQGISQGQNVTYESALKQVRDHYDAKQKQMLAIAGANVSPTGQNGYPNRYAGVEKDLFALTDKEFKEQEMRPRDATRRLRQRQQSGF